MQNNKTDDINKVSDLFNLFELTAQNPSSIASETNKSDGRTYYTANSTFSPQRTRKNKIIQNQKIADTFDEVSTKNEIKRAPANNTVEEDQSKSSIESGIFKKFGNSLRDKRKSSIKQLNKDDVELKQFEYAKLIEVEQTKPLSGFAKNVKSCCIFH